MHPCHNHEFFLQSINSICASQYEGILLKKVARVHVECARAQDEAQVHSQDHGSFRPRNINSPPSGRRCILLSRESRNERTAGKNVRYFMYTLSILLAFAKLVTSSVFNNTASLSI